MCDTGLEKEGLSDGHWFPWGLWCNRNRRNQNYIEVHVPYADVVVIGGFGELAEAFDAPPLLLRPHLTLTR